MTDGRPKDKLLQFCKPSNNSSCPHSRHPPIRINRMAIRQLSKAEPLIDGPALLTPIPADVAELFYRDVFDLTVNCLISNGSFSSPAGLYSTCLLYTSKADGKDRFVLEKAKEGQSPIS